MTDEQVMQRLQAVAIPIEPDFAVPMNGKQRPLPYMIVRKKVTTDGSDNGNVRFLVTEWIVALFMINKDTVLESKIARALTGVGKVEVNSFPDGTPYQTNFEFKTRQIMR